MRDTPTQLAGLALLALGTGALLLLASPGAWRIAPDAPRPGPEPWTRVLESGAAADVAGLATPRAPR